MSNKIDKYIGKLYASNTSDITRYVDKLNFYIQTGGTKSGQIQIVLDELDKLSKSQPTNNILTNEFVNNKKQLVLKLKELIDIYETRTKQFEVGGQTLLDNIGTINKSIDLALLLSPELKKMDKKFSNPNIESVLYHKATLNALGKYDYSTNKFDPVLFGKLQFFPKLKKYINLILQSPNPRVIKNLSVKSGIIESDIRTILTELEKIL